MNNMNEYFEGLNRSLRGTSKQERQFDQFEASELYCPHCKQAVPLRKNLLLVLPDGERYDYRCVYCGTSVGTKTVAKESQNLIIL